METLFQTASELAVAMPVIALAITALLLLSVGLLRRPLPRSIFLTLFLGGIIASGFFAVRLWESDSSAFYGTVLGDNFTVAFNLLFLLSAALSGLLAANRHEVAYLRLPEFFAVALFATIGMMLMAGSRHLLVIFLGLETLSISLYVLAASKRTEYKSLEAAFKYFLLGAFASAFLLYGIALIFGETGALEISRIAEALAGESISSHPLLLAGGILIVIGLGFKAAIFPFHQWAPDVYEGAPTPIAAFMATGSKAAAFATLLRISMETFRPSWDSLIAVLWVLAAGTMLVGNISALLQKNVKRMLAFSSIAHAGYLLVGIVAWNVTGAAGVVFYLLAYTLMNAGAFGVISFLSTAEHEYLEISDFNGIAYRKPAVALLLSLFMFSLSGLPPTAGFVGKFYLFSAAVQAGQVSLVILAVVNSMISMYYYLALVVAMFMKPESEGLPVAAALPAVGVALALAAAGTLLLGLFPSGPIAACRDLVATLI